MPGNEPETDDIRCPHCKVVILKKERRDERADRSGAPEFCPRCGERVEPLRDVKPPTTTRFAMP